jgi:hypothetical protein
MLVACHNQKLKVPDKNISQLDDATNIMLVI